MYRAYRINTVLNGVLQSLVLLYQGIAAVIFIASLFLAFNWFKNPFIGGFFEQTLILNGSDTSEAGKQWALYEQGFNLGDQLVSIEDQRISNAGQLRSILSSFRTNETVPVTIRTSDVQNRTVDITLQPFPLPDRIAYFRLPAFLSWVFLP